MFLFHSAVLRLTATRNLFFGIKDAVGDDMQYRKRIVVFKLKAQHKNTISSRKNCSGQ